MTVLFTVALFPDEFVTLYVIVYVSALLVSTFPDITIALVMSPSFVSFADAPRVSKSIIKLHSHIGSSF